MKTRNIGGADGNIEAGLISVSFAMKIVRGRKETSKTGEAITCGAVTGWSNVQQLSLAGKQNVQIIPG